MHRWMESNFRRIGHKRLYELFLPGSHNSGAYTLSNNPSDNSGELLGKWYSRLAIPLVKKWCITQSITVLDQLKSGVRFLDFGCDYHNGEFYISNNLIGVRYVKIFEQILKFINDCQSEIIILCFSRFNNAMYHELFYNILATSFGVKIARRSEWNMPIDYLINSGRQIIVVYNDDSMVENHPKLLPMEFINNIHIPTNTLYDLRVHLEKTAVIPRKFAVLSCYLTPDAKDIRDGIKPGFGCGNNPSNLLSMADYCNEMMIPWVTQCILKPGIILTDNVSHEICKHIINMNWRDNGESKSLDYLLVK